MADKKRFIDKFSDKFILRTTLATVWGLSALSIGGTVAVSVTAPKAAETVLMDAGMTDIRVAGKFNVASKEPCPYKFQTFNPTAFEAKKDGKPVNGIVCFTNLSDSKGAIVYKPTVANVKVTFKPFS